MEKTAYPQASPEAVSSDQQVPTGEVQGPALMRPLSTIEAQNGILNGNLPAEAQINQTDSTEVTGSTEKIQPQGTLGNNQQPEIVAVVPGTPDVAIRIESPVPLETGEDDPHEAANHGTDHGEDFSKKTTEGILKNVVETPDIPGVADSQPAEAQIPEVQPNNVIDLQTKAAEKAKQKNEGADQKEKKTNDSDIGRAINRLLVQQEKLAADIAALRRAEEITQGMDDDLDIAA